jgi:hypothetical protein
MTLGRHLRELWNLRKGLAISLCVALLAAGWSVGKISLFPPGLKMRSLEIAAASTTALVDAPKSAILDLQVNTSNLEAMTNRALLIGNMMASPPVHSYIVRRAGLPAGAVLNIISPVTPNFPRQLTTSGKKSPTDILKSPNQYRLLIQANPTVPVLELDATAPSAKAAAQLVNGAVEGTQDYLRGLGSQEEIPPQDQVTLKQLGTAHGGIINPGVSLETAALSFFLVFTASAATTLWLARVRKGWKGAARRSDDLQLSS